MNKASRTFLQRVAHRSSQRGRTPTTFSCSLHSSSSSTGAAIETPHQWADPLVREYRYWNRENTKEKGKYSFLIEISPDSIKRESRILSLSSADDPANQALHHGTLPVGAQLLGIGQSPADFDHIISASDSSPSSQPNTLFVSPSCPNASEQLPAILKQFPSVDWVHVRSAGIDFVVSEELNAFRDKVQFTNAKVMMKLTGSGCGWLAIQKVYSQMFPFILFSHTGIWP
jgi:hypothetical protein